MQGLLYATLYCCDVWDPGKSHEIRLCDWDPYGTTATCHGTPWVTQVNALAVIVEPNKPRFSFIAVVRCDVSVKRADGE
jgi:hypothetical protein